MLSNCGSDEYGGISGGQAGDQTGKEWRLINWYNGSWTHIFRFPDPRVGRLIARLAIQAALNDLIGYDQSQRLTFWYRLMESNYDPSQIKRACEADCSAGVAAICKAVGNLLGIESLKRIPETMSTWVEATTLRAAGFQVITASEYLTSESKLQPGDILLKFGHTATEVGNGRLSDFPWEDDEMSKEDVQAINQRLDQINSNLNAVLTKLAPQAPVAPFGGMVYRLINPTTGAHTWTNSSDRRENLLNQGWKSEGDAFELGQAGEPVWCLIHPLSGECMLTASMTEAKSIANAGWQSEGIVGTAGDGPDVYRLYNSKNGYHLFTTSKNEASTLVASGWVDEGIAFKAL